MAEVIGSYRILERIRIVHREAFVAQKDGAEPVVVCCYPWPPGREELEADLARAREIEHPASLRLLDHFEHDGRLALVFERFECLSLAKILGHLAEHAEDLACGAVVYIGAEVAAALVEGQRGFRPGKINRRLVHGDVGPERVLVGWDGTVKLAGLGLRLLAAEARPEGKPTERPVRGRPTGDAYALAATLWTALLREAPDPTKPLPKLEERRPEIDRQLRFALERALTADDRRPYSIQTLANLLQRGVREADKNELIWNMDVLRWIVGGGVSEEVAALPPNREAAGDESSAREPLDSGERHTPVSTRRTSRWRFPREGAPEPDESGAHITARWQRASLQASGARGPRLPAAGPRPRAQRWLGAIVVSSLLAFGFGVAATLVLDDSDRGPSAADASAADTSAAAINAGEPAEASEDRASATALASAASAAPDPKPRADPLSDEGADALPPGEGFLVVQSPRRAGVYVGGKLVGTTGERLRAPCGTHFVRIGSVPLKRWYGSGQAVRIQCRSLTSVAIAEKRKR